MKINSREVCKNDIFFAIKGKKNDGNKFVAQSFQRKASLAIVNKIQNKLNNNRQIKVKNTLKFLTEFSKIYRKNIDTKIIAITGSCGKTTLKELLGNTLSKISKVSISPKSYIEPDVGVITNINYAHAKNFKSIKQIALAKSEIIKNIRPNGFVVLNTDDNFFELHKKIAYKKNLKVISFGIKSNKADIKLSSIKPLGKQFKINISFNNENKYFLLSNNFQNNIYNILSAIAVISIHKNILKLHKDIFLNF